GDEERIGRFGRHHGAQPAGGDDAVNRNIEIGLDDVDAAVPDGCDGVGIDIDPDDVYTSRGEDGSGGKADVAQADDTDTLEAHSDSCRTAAILSAACPSP